VGDEGRRASQTDRQTDRERGRSRGENVIEPEDGRRRTIDRLIANSSRVLAGELARLRSTEQRDTDSRQQSLVRERQSLLQGIVTQDAALPGANQNSTGAVHNI